MIIWVIIAVIILLVLWYILTYNSFISWGNKVDEAYSTMDIYLKKRYDLIPNIVETVKGYAAHEQSTLEKVINARNKAVGASKDDKSAAEGELQGSLRQLFALAESYPELKANTNFINLQNQLSSIEDEIASARKYYNGCARQFNTKVESIPSSLVAGIAHFGLQPMFQVENEEERKNVKVQF